MTRHALTAAKPQSSEIAGLLAFLLTLMLALAAMTLPASAQAPAKQAPAVQAPVVQAPAATPASAQPASPPKQAQVKVGVYINDIQAINLHDNTFSADLYIWFRNSDPELAPGDTFEFMNVAAPTDHLQTPLQKEPLAQPDGSKYQLFRHQGLFVSKFSVRTYPFDTQQLLINVEDQQSSAERMTYVVDEISMNPAIQIPGYIIGKPAMQIVNKPYPTAFGDLTTPQALPYSRAIISLAISRPILAGIIKTFLPILIIVMVAAAALILDPSHLDARVGLAITALLTLVALQFTATQNLPEVSYLLMLDQVYFTSYGYVLLVVALLVRSTGKDDAAIAEGNVDAVERLSRGGPMLAFASLFVYLAVVGGIIAFNLS